MERLKNIVINFNNLTSEEKLLLKGWIKNITNSNEIYNMNDLVEDMLNDISEGKSPTYIRNLHTITNRKLKCNSKSPSEVINISAPQVMI